MTGELLTEHHLEFLSLKGGCTGLSECILVKCHIVKNHVSRLTTAADGIHCTEISCDH